MAPVFLSNSRQERIKAYFLTCWNKCRYLGILFSLVVCHLIISSVEKEEISVYFVCVTGRISKLSSPLCVQHWDWIRGSAELIWSRWCGRVIIVLLFTHSQLTMYHLPRCESRADNMLPVRAMWFPHIICVTHYIYFHNNSEILCK